MTIALFANPRSGTGKAAANALRAAKALAAAGHTVRRIDIGPSFPAPDYANVLRGTTAMIVAGGDGSLRSLALQAARFDVPLYHLPSGNENLFARAFGMTADPAHLVNALRRGNVTRIDMGHASWTTEPTLEVKKNTKDAGDFCIMASLGPDAGVCHRLDATRTRATGKLAYFWPVIEEFAQPTIHRLSVTADGREVLHGRGLLVVANLHCYALGIDPSHDADPTDGLLNASFIPAETAVDVVNAMVRLRTRVLPHDAIRFRARQLSVTPDAPPLAIRLQLDGESAPWCLSPNERVGSLPSPMVAGSSKPSLPPRPPESPVSFQATTLVFTTSAKTLPILSSTG